MRCCCPPRRQRIVVVGASDKAGATTIALRLHFRKVVPALPGNATELWPSTIELNGRPYQVEIVDVGREGKTPKALQGLLEDAVGLIFVVDSTNIGPPQRQAFELSSSFLPRTGGIYVLANFQDRQAAHSPTTVCQLLGLPLSTEPVASGGDVTGHPLPRWTCQPCVGTHPALRPENILRFLLLSELRPLFSVPHEMTADPEARLIAASPYPPDTPTRSLSPPTVPRPQQVADSPKTTREEVEVDGSRFMAHRRRPSSSSRTAATVSYLDVDGEDGGDQNDVVEDPTDALPLSDLQRKRLRKLGIGSKQAPLLDKAESSQPTFE